LWLSFGALLQHLRFGVLRVLWRLLLATARRLRRHPPRQRSGSAGCFPGVVYIFWPPFALVACCSGWWYWRQRYHGPPLGRSWHSLRDLLIGSQQYHFDGSLFGPSVSTFIALALLTVARLLVGRMAGAQQKHLLTSMDRLMGHLLAIPIVWALLAGLWELARWLVVQANTTPGLLGGAGSVSGLSSMTAVLGLLFYWARDWLMKPKEEGDETQPTSLVLRFLKPWVPLLLANGIVVLLFLLAAVYLLQGNRWNGNVSYSWILLVVSCCLLVLVLVLFLFDPATVGLHEFYRARLARCYLGASQAASTANRDWAERPGDDMFLKDDRGTPIHLICCAANQIWGDPLSTLHRGARSAVLSRFGIALGNRWIIDERLRLSAALTASAAAFNSLMGELNVTLGRAVPFVMTALNLRLGLWVRNPASTANRGQTSSYLPGQFFLREMLGCAQCRTDGKNAGAYIHLSDGGHFENLALYELVRRHCRYIIVSDAGEDQKFAFTDFGRATRRVREDFGVEIEIDLTPLRPGEDGFPQQHIAVGVIHYDGVVGTDKGTLVYLKPALTGDEPPDVLQYQKRKPVFPHESTSDQFFDEAQFESYRRLGEHTGHASFRPVELRQNDGKTKSDENLFHELRQFWQRVPWLHSDDGVRLCAHAAALEETLRAQPGTAARREFGGDFLKAEPTHQEPGKTVAAENDTGQITDDLMLAMQAFKFMEEAWVICELDRYWSNPRARSWVTYLHRWASMPTLRKWWPAIKSLYGNDFTAFANTQLHLTSVDIDASGGKARHARLTLCHYDINQAPSLQPNFNRRLQECRPEFSLTRDCEFFGLCLTLPVGAETDLGVQVGLAAIEVSEETARWHADDLFVPPELKGGGFNTQLLDKLIAYFKSKTSPGKDVRLEVNIAEAHNEPKLKDNNSAGSDTPAQGAGSTTVTRLRRTQAGRQEQIELIDFYRSRGFMFDGSRWTNGQNTRMILVLHHTD
jgi:hypothetical protein